MQSGRQILLNQCGLDYRMFWTKRGKMICYFHFLVRPISDLYGARYGKLFLSPFDVYFRCFFRCFFVRNIWARNENRIWRPGELAWKPIEARRNIKNVHSGRDPHIHSQFIHASTHIGVFETLLFITRQQWRPNNIFYLSSSTNSECQITYFINHPPTLKVKWHISIYRIVP